MKMTIDIDFNEPVDEDEVTGDLMSLVTNFLEEDDDYRFLKCDVSYEWN